MNADYQRDVLGLMHRLRVDPWDDYARMMLCDLLIDSDSPEMMKRVVEPVQRGGVAVGLLDRDHVVGGLLPGLAQGGYKRPPHL
jgi:hypothetical protein